MCFLSSSCRGLEYAEAWNMSRAISSRRKDHIALVAMNAISHGNEIGKSTWLTQPKLEPGRGPGKSKRPEKYL